MRVRTVLVATGLLSAVLGGVAAYLALTVPNDLQAGTLLKQARSDLAAGKNDDARKSLTAVVQQYPRTDAAAAATVALAKLAREEMGKLEREIAMLKRKSDQQAKLLADLQRSVTGVEKSLTGVEKTVTEVKNAPPKTIIVERPAPKKAPPKKPARKTPPRRTRRR
ncbi:MAG TPA: hypothetical protein VFL80_10290 [Thermoanaerobaculia bacterium]|nr:hypothetical protein [Thermoanaerobaculia bacterium]